MTFIEEMKGYVDYLKKYKFLIIALYVLIEIAIFLKIGTTNIFTFASSFFVTLFVICSMFLMFKDFETNLIVYLAGVPLIPLSLYILARLGLKFIGTPIYFIYFAIFIINVYKNRNEIDLFKVSVKGKYKGLIFVYIILIVLALISTIFSYNRLESLKLMFMVLISMILLSLTILSYKKLDRMFIEKIITYLAIGVTISSIPDIVVAIFNLVFRGVNQHLYGALGSNFMLGYTIIVLPYILMFSVNKDILPRYNWVYKILMVIQIVNLSTQKSRGILVAVAFCIILVTILDIKNYKKYLFISLIIFACLGYNVSHRWEFNEIKEEIEIKGSEALLDNGGLIGRFIEQAKSRRPIWNVALAMIFDHPYFGVGLGQFKNFYVTYGGSPKKIYMDAHNIIFDIATEVGLIFTAVFFISILILVIKSIICCVKNRRYIQILCPAIIGIMTLFIYGNITGQAFFTSTYPISITPAFVFVVIISIMVKVIKHKERE
ncbi:MULTISPECIES: O-antigen ligase family protein [Clostridium]|uniref:O-antigen ligase n=1 Tax=Clostridium colicanis DSM 13634 TaxID=1121305 RepID=A0A151AR81_9CLOT|nr:MULTISPECIES: O-antigen ligase family protein [Clostridium]KYH30148.1 O-antigen ligase [Clostridium colicanis DSM 13634]MBE6044622.1 O-antigen ligase family protein [Clostridium thermopalmarium]